MSRKLALVQWSKTLAVLLIIAGLQILLLDVALFIAYFFLTNFISFLTFFLTIFQLTKKERKAPLYGNLPPSLYSLHY